MKRKEREFITHIIKTETPHDITEICLLIADNLKKGKRPNEKIQ